MTADDARLVAEHLHARVEETHTLLQISGRATALEGRLIQQALKNQLSLVDALMCIISALPTTAVIHSAASSRVRGDA